MRTVKYGSYTKNDGFLLTAFFSHQHVFHSLPRDISHFHHPASKYFPAHKLLLIFQYKGDLSAER
jgi:hypothetical protein